jgi:hypothetical protein
MFPNPRFFIHIPKTAGTSFGGFLRSQTKASMRQLRIDYPRTDELLKTVDRAVLYGGHSFRADVEAIATGRTVDFFTFFRDPEQRLLSNLRFHFKFPKIFGRKSQFLPAQFDRIHETEGLNKVLDIVREDNHELHFKLRNIQAAYVKRRLSNDEPADTKEDVDTLAAVGMTEDYLVSLLLMAYKLGFLPPCAETRANETGPSRPEVLTDENMEFYLSGDQACWAFAQNRIASDLEAMFSDLGTREPVKLREKIITRNLAARQDLELVAGFTDGEWRKSKNLQALRDDDENYAEENVWAVSGVPAEIWVRFPETGQLSVGFCAPYDDNDPEVHLELDGERWSLKTSRKSIEIRKPELSGKTTRLTIMSTAAGRSDAFKKQNLPVIQDFPNVALCLFFSSDAEGTANGFGAP